MKHLGRASASQAIAAYRHDFMVKKAGLRWPDASDERNPNLLPARRLDVLLRAVPVPSFWLLEAAWDLYELSPAELLTVRAMWGEPPYGSTLQALLDDVRRGDYEPAPDHRERIRRLREQARAGTLEIGQLVAVRGALALASSAVVASDVADEDMCLLDGHGRVLALGLEGRLEQTSAFPVLIGSRPVRLGTAVVNGKPEARRRRRRAKRPS